MKEHGITYLHRGLQPFKINVRLDGRRVGDIVRIIYGPTGQRTHGYAYRTNSGGTGKIFPTLEACKRSIEED